MGKLFKLSVFVAVVAALVFVGMRATETSSLFGRDGSPGLFSLLRSALIKDKVAASMQDYDKRSDRLADGSVQEQDSTMVEKYYNIATDFYEYGWSQSFHFAHTKADEGHEESIIRHERFLADSIGIKEGMKVLDAGCGVGGPARNIAAYTKAKITGITINEYQVSRAKEHTKRMKLDDLCDFQVMDFTKISFPDNSFDRAYAIEATCHATDLADVYKEIFRVLKPGGLFGTYEWLVTPVANTSDPAVKKILRDIEYGSGLPPLHSFEDAVKAAKKVGFEVLFDKDLALETEGTRPWYHKLDMSYISTRMTHYFTWFMETVGLAPAGSLATHTMLLHAVDGLVAGGKTGTFTPMHLIVMKKPEKAAAPAPAPAPAKPVAPAPAPAPAAAKPAAPAPAPAKAAPAPAPAKPAAAGKV